MKTFQAVLFAVVLMILATGCSSSSEPRQFVYTDDHVEMVATFPQEAYKQTEIISLSVTVKNRSDETLTYVQGSGSNQVPDGLTVELDGLAGIFSPEIMTMDYQMATLEPGESKIFECPFVPYRSNDGTTVFGNDKQIKDFDTDEFTLADKGTVEGTVEFAYVPADDDTGMILLIDEEDLVYLDGKITVEIK